MTIEVTYPERDITESWASANPDAAIRAAMEWVRSGWGDDQEVNEYYEQMEQWLAQGHPSVLKTVRNPDGDLEVWRVVETDG